MENPTNKQVVHERENQCFVVFRRYFVGANTGHIKWRNNKTKYKFQNWPRLWVSPVRCELFEFWLVWNFAPVFPSQFICWKPMGNHFHFYTALWRCLFQFKFCLHCKIGYYSWKNWIFSVFDWSSLAVWMFAFLKSTKKYMYWLCQVVIFIIKNSFIFPN